MNPNKILEVNGLSKNFNNLRAVDNISFSLEKGDIFAFLGPNGAGKTTTLRILLDIIKGDQGTMVWNLNGKESSLPPADQIGYLPEERGLYTDLPVIRSLVYLASIRGMDAAQAKSSAMKWLEKLDLADRAKEKLQALSKGNQQKIQFVASILHKPAFAILDEPFSGLDPVNQEKFIEYIRELNDSGTTILLSSHQMPLVERIAQKVFLINQGAEVYNGRLDDIYRNFRQPHRFELSFAGEIPARELENLAGVESVVIETPGNASVVFNPGFEINQILLGLSDMGSIREIRSHQASLHDIFLTLVKNHES